MVDAVSICSDLKPHVELRPASVCVWTVGEQVGIVSVRRREIDGVGSSAGRGYSLTVMAEAQTAGACLSDCVCACLCVCVEMHCVTATTGGLKE